MRKHLIAFLFIAVSFQLIQAQVAMSLVSGGNISNASKFLVDQKSVLLLKGTTNVNSFTCKCKDNYHPQSFFLKNSTSDLLEFTETRLQLAIATLDCGNKKMNTDLQKALNATTHPKIKVELLKVKIGDECYANIDCVSENLTEALVYAQISINGKSNRYWIDVELRKSSENKFFVLGQKRLNMLDFGVKPPEVFFGAVKVNSGIDIVFDLGISLTN